MADGAIPRNAFKVVLGQSRWHSLLDELLALPQEGGGIARLPSFPAPTYLVGHPDGVRHVLHDNAGNYRKGVFFRTISQLQGQGLLTSEGEEWQRQRRVAQPAFRQDVHGAAYGLIMSEEAEGIGAGWREAARARKPINVATWMQRLTFRVAARALLGVRPEDLNELGRRLQDVGDRIRPFLASGTTGACAPARWVPVLLRRRFRHAISDYHAIVHQLIEERIAARADEAGQAPNLMDLLIAAHGSRANQRRQLRDQVIAFIGASVETTAQALSWAWYLLARHAECEERLCAELDTVLCGSRPRMADLPRLSYTRMVVDEVLRLYPPAAVIPRQANAAGQHWRIQGATECEDADQSLRHPPATRILAASGSIQAGAFRGRP